MSIHDKLIESIAGEDGELVLNFFATFSAFECALKRTGFVKCGPYNSAEPDWTAFAQAVKTQLAKKVETTFTESKKYLVRNPPMKQMFTKSSSGAGVNWEKNSKRENETEEEYLLRLVRDVRNNLFHGGKYPYSGADLSAHELRNRKLLEACITILSQCCSLNNEIELFFREAFQ